jgi:threonine dehydratase
MPTPFPDLVLRASERLTPHIRLTPTDPAPGLGPHAFLKLENFQLTGSFKIRGALNKLLTLTPEQRSKGVVVASTGNHGAAAAYGSRLLTCPCTVFAPENTDESKLSGIRSRGAQLVLEGSECLDSESRARRYAEENGLTYISPYNDLEVAAGQGSLGVELGLQVPDLERVYVAVGGGGLIAGVGAHLKSLSEGTEVVGCCPELSDVMARSVPEGRIVDMPFVPTLSDGTAGSLEEDCITLPLCTRYVDRFERVSEEEIADSVRWVLENHRMLIEGAAGVAVAVARRELEQNGKARTAVVLCGSNISADKLRTILG